MTQETGATPPVEEQPQAEPEKVETPPQPEPAKPQEPVIPLKAYQGLQREYQKLYDSKIQSDKQLSGLQATTDYLTKSTQALVKTTLGEEKAAALDAELASARTDAQRKSVEQAAIDFTQKQSELLFEVLQVSGIDPNSIRWPTDAKSPGEWYEAARDQVVSAVASQQRKFIKAVEKAQLDAAKQAKAQGVELANAELKKAGVGKIDTSRGTATSGLSRLENMDPTSKEFHDLIKLAEQGKLKEI